MLEKLDNYMQKKKKKEKKRKKKEIRTLPNKEINPEHSFEGLMLKLKLHYFGHLM